MINIIHKIQKIKLKKIHYFDLFVVLALLIVASIFLYNRLTKKSIWIDARISISDNELWWNGEFPQYWLLNELEPGMISYNSFGEDVAEITNVEFFTQGGPYKQAFVDIKLKVDFDPKRQTYQYNFRTIEKGKPVDLTFGSNNVSGLVVALNSEPEQRYTKKIKVKVERLEDWLANSYKAGMEMKDSKGRSLARIDKVTLQNNKLSPITVSGGKLYYDSDQYKDVYLEMTITTLKDEEGYFRFLDGATIKIGEEIWFQLPELVVKSRIMEIIE